MKGFIEIHNNYHTTLINVNQIKYIRAHDDDDVSTSIVLVPDNDVYIVHKRYDVVKAEILEAMK